MNGPKWQAEGNYSGLTEPDYLVLYAGWATIRLSRGKDRIGLTTWPTWLATCGAVSMHSVPLGDIPLLEAKRVAVAKVRHELRARLDELETVKA